MANVLLSAAERIYGAALEAVEPRTLVQKNISRSGDRLIVQGKSFSLTSYRRIFLVAVGKAAPYLAREVSSYIKDKLTQGIVLCPPGKKLRLKKLACLPAAHPLPDKRSTVAARKILRLARLANDRDLFLVLLSGGGSAQVSLPLPGVALEEKRQITESLLKAGANIQELNAVRKHLSAFKGGRLARAAFPATVVNLVVSDVIGNDLETIASGPTQPDSSTYAGAKGVLEKYGLWESAPRGVKEAIRRGIEGKIEETLKPKNPIFKGVQSFILGDNNVALEAARAEASDLGFNSRIIKEGDSGEASTAAKKYLVILDRLTRPAGSNADPLCLVAGGELTVTVRGPGKGGRNQEFILACLCELEKRRKGYLDYKFNSLHKDWLFLSLGTDGVDGPTDAAGAWIDPSTLERVRELSLKPQEFLDDNNSYGFFERAGGMIKTGPTKTNVMDIRIFLFRGVS
jgi:glycerate 2-kinase